MKNWTIEEHHMIPAATAKAGEHYAAAKRDEATMQTDMGPPHIHKWIAMMEAMGEFAKSKTDPTENFQKAIVIELALHPSTVSKMLAALERLGWIKRVRFMLNRRYKVINVTALGLKRIWMAMRLLWRQRPLLREFERLARQFFPDRHVLDGLDYLYLLIEAIARDRGDECRLWFEYGSRTIDSAWVPVHEDKTWLEELNRGCH